MSKSDGHFECRLHRRLENGNGIYLTLLVNPADATGDLSQLRVGSTLMIAWAETVNAEVEKIELPREKPKRRFDELSAPEQAGILSNDLKFQLYVSTRFASSTALDTAEFIREHCGVPSRSQLTSENVAWKNLIRDFRAWHTDQRYAESIHR